MTELRPLPLSALVTRMFRELDETGSIFDLPRGAFFLGDRERDYSVRFHHKRAATALGPAAGPQSQLAQNIVLSWLGGSRILELKTVQINDELKIPRPCIDMQTVGYNVEWSQELRLEQSLEEYVKAAMLIDMLIASGALELAPGFTDTVWDMSVGYDLAGIRSDRVQTFIDGMLDCTTVVDRLRPQVPEAYRHYRDLDFPARLSDTLTLSTFHGCPPDEIERMIEFLLHKGLHSIVKLNPMLLGPDETRRLLHDELGYDDIRVPDTAFERDTRWDQACGFVERLGTRAATLGLGFGVKFTNTLIVENHRSFFPDDQKEMYLSGPPLHVLAMHLVQQFRATFGDRYAISFSAGIDRKNFSDAVALGLVPVTVCSDLLKPGGYARSRAYLVELRRRMDAVGARNISEFIDKSSTDGYVDGLTKDPRYAKANNVKLPPKIGSALELFDCITCDKCIPVCPNAANFTFVLPALEAPIVKVWREHDRWTTRQEGTLRVEEKHQIGNFADFCNDCGNCDVFCPEDGGPYIVKPRFFGSLADWTTFSALDGFVLEGDTLYGRCNSADYTLQPGAPRSRFTGPGFDLQVDQTDPLDDIQGQASGEIDFTWFHVMRWIRDAVYCDGALHYPALATNYP